jgi:hypothetical protein
LAGKAYLVIFSSRKQLSKASRVSQESRTGLAVFTAEVHLWLSFIWIKHLFLVFLTTMAEFQMIQPLLLARGKEEGKGPKVQKVKVIP